MAWHTPSVYLGLDGGPFDGGGFYDVTDDVMGALSIRQGRTVEFDRPQAGSLQLTLSNYQRKFDPNHAAGPYYGKLKARNRIRVEANGVQLFNGWVQGWPQSYDPQTGQMTVTLQAFDSLGMLAQTSLARSPYHAVQMRYSPDGYWPIDGDFQEVVLDVSGNDNHAAVTTPNDIAKGDAPTLPLGAKASMDWKSNVGGSVIIPPIYNGVTPKRYQAISVWFSGYGANEVPAYGTGPLYGPSPIVWVDDSRTPGNSAKQLIGLYGFGQSIDVDLGGNAYIASFTLQRPVLDNLWHHIFVCVDRTANQCKLWLDGELQGTVSSSGSRGLFEVSFTATNYRLMNGQARPFWGASLPNTKASNLAFMQSATSELFTDAASALYQAALGWPGQVEAQRVSTILDLVGWPSSHRSAGYQGGPMPTENELSGSALDYLFGLTRQDGSSVLALRDGKVRFRNRSELFAATRSQTVQAAFGETSAATLRYVGIVPALDDAFLYNAISGKRKGALFGYAIKDQASIDTSWYRNLDLGEIRAFDDLDLLGFMAYMLRRYSVPRNRLTALTVDARVNAATMAEVLDLTIGDRVTVDFTPGGYGTAIAFDQWIEGVSHEIDVSAMSWRTTYACSPAEGSANVFILGTSTINSSAVLGQ